VRGVAEPTTPPAAARVKIEAVPRLLLERERELAELGAAAREAMEGRGSVVLVTGEAGIGKSSLVDSARSVLPAEGRLLVGFCDDLATPRVLGPLRDLTGRVGTALTAALESGDRGRVFEALRVELDWPHHPTVLVVEDVHWADDATLDALRYLVRRVAAMPVVLVLTYRDDELTPQHPLRQLLGLVAGTPGVRRLRLARLSPAAVRRLGADRRIDADRVFLVTSGNPFFVTEVLAAGDVDAVPATVAEAVAARLSMLDPAGRTALGRLAVVPSAVERWLVEAVVPDGLDGLADAEQRGVLTVSPRRIAFRHELMRRAIVDSMPAAQRVAANREVLAALLGREGVDLSRIVHHAAEAGDEDVVIRYAPAAAREAAAAGSHREAVAHYQLVLEHRAAFQAAERADLLEGFAVECYTLGVSDAAVRAQEEAVRLRREVGDRRALGLALRWLSRMHWWAGWPLPAERCAAEAIDVLTTAGDAAALALALSNQSQLHILAGRTAPTVEVGQRAVDMARALGATAVLTHALNNVGMARWYQGRDVEGRALLDESLEVALRAGEFDHACRAYCNIAWHLIDNLHFDEAAGILAEGIEVAERAEFLSFLKYMHVCLGRIALGRGEWDIADSEAEWAMDSPPNMRCAGLFVRGRVRLRRGLPDGDEIVAGAWELARRIGEPQRLGPAGAAMAEAAWLRGDGPAAGRELVEAYELVRGRDAPAYAADFGYWLRRLGVDVVVDDTGYPHADQAAGRWRQAARVWQAAGCRYEHADALSNSADPADLLAALTILDELGAEPLARRVRRQLRDRGVARVPRGPIAATRDNPAGLTGRQVEVLRLLAEGLSNAEIAARLVLSVRTVDTHVAAVMEKLAARTRHDAVARALTLGVL
jgi:DNA-binding CsgD family transcriptional regulator/tetratricopeptide (TPR) repeat protein